MTDIEIIGLPQSNFVWAVRLACAEKGVPHRLTPAMAHTPEVDAVHPIGRVPCLRHGAATLFESRAILAYIDRVLDGPRLTPADPRAAAALEQWVSLVVTTLEPLAIRKYLFGYMFPQTADKSPDRAQIDAAWPDLERLLGVIADAIDAGHIGAGSFSLVDAYLIPILFYLHNTPEAGRLIAESPALSAYLARAMALQSVRDTLPPPPPGA